MKDSTRQAGPSGPATHDTRDVVREVAAWADKTDNVRAVILTSSRTNPDSPVDLLSDYDIELIVEDLDPFLEGDGWLTTFGEILVRWPHKPVRDRKCVTRLVMFDNTPRIDFQIKMREVLERNVSAPHLPEFYDIGYEIVLDKDGITKDLAPPTHTAYRTRQPTEAEYDEIAHHFWWSATYVAKYLYRDELFFAKYMLDDALHHKYLRTAIAWHIGMKNRWAVNPGVHGRWFKHFVEPETWADVEETFAGADSEENWKALFKTAEVFGRLTSEVGAHLGYTYPIELDWNVTAYLAEIRELADGTA